MSVKCAECRCAPQECINANANQRCQNCTKEICCCIVIHQNYARSMKLSVMDDDCCSHGACKNNSNNAPAELRTKNKKSIYEFFRHVKSLYAAALGIVILCIAAAEFGENTGLY